jgi:hypothetical protein
LRANKQQLPGTKDKINQKTKHNQKQPGTMHALD